MGCANIESNCHHGHPCDFGLRDNRLLLVLLPYYFIVSSFVVLLSLVSLSRPSSFSVLLPRRSCTSHYRCYAMNCSQLRNSSKHCTDGIRARSYASRRRCDSFHMYPLVGCACQPVPVLKRRHIPTMRECEVCYDYAACAMTGCAKNMLRNASIARQFYVVGTKFNLCTTASMNGTNSCGPIGDLRHRRSMKPIQKMAANYPPPHHWLMNCSRILVNATDRGLSNLHASHLECELPTTPIR